MAGTYVAYRSSSRQFLTTEADTTSRTTPCCIGLGPCAEACSPCHPIFCRKAPDGHRDDHQVVPVAPVATRLDRQSIQPEQDRGGGCMERAGTPQHRHDANEPRQHVGRARELPEARKKQEQALAMRRRLYGKGDHQRCDRRGGLPSGTTVSTGWFQPCGPPKPSIGSGYWPGSDSSRNPPTVGSWGPRGDMVVTESRTARLIGVGRGRSWVGVPRRTSGCLGGKRSTPRPRLATRRKRSSSIE
jgi:hypothetical protein